VAVLGLGVWTWVGLSIDEPVWTQLTGSTATEDWAAANFVDSSGTILTTSWRSSSPVWGPGSTTATAATGTDHLLAPGGMATVRFGGDDEELVFADSGSNLWAFYGRMAAAHLHAMDAASRRRTTRTSSCQVSPASTGVGVDFGSVASAYNYGTGGLVTSIGNS